MKERPILMSTPMVKALLEGRKTQTRRIVKFKYLPEIGGAYGETVMIYGKTGQHYMPCPYGSIGDILWVRETWLIFNGMYGYKAEVTSEEAKKYKWKPSIFMPKKACRLKLKITNIRVERLQEITEDDAIAEGIEWGLHMILNRPRFRNYYSYPKDGGAWYHDPRDSYKSLWESINGKGSWEKNPWVWVIEFKRIQS
jgi:hypothetical protein